MDDEREIPDGAARLLKELEALLEEFGQIEGYFLRQPEGRAVRAERGLRQRYELAREHAHALLAGLADQASVFRRPGIAASYGRGTPLSEKAGEAVSCLGSIRLDVIRNPDRWREKLAKKKARGAMQQQPVTDSEPPCRIFLGHGRNPLWREVEAHLKSCGLEVEAYETESRAGHAVVETLKKLADACGFAVIVATAEDATEAGTKRMRQNVVHEIGLFHGKRGFARVAILLQDGVEGLSNLDGLGHIPFSGDDLRGALHDLDRMLEREGLLPRRARAGAGT